MFGFGKKKSSSSSSSSAQTYVDPSQAPYLQDVRENAQGTFYGGFPVEGVAGLNPALLNAMRQQNLGGMQQAQAGTGIMGVGAEQLAGTGQAMDYASSQLNANPNQGIGTAFGAGNAYSSGVPTVNAAQRPIDNAPQFRPRPMNGGYPGGGINPGGMYSQAMPQNLGRGRQNAANNRGFGFGRKNTNWYNNRQTADDRMANRMADNARTSSAARNYGMNTGEAQRIGDLAQSTDRTNVGGPDFGIAQDSGQLAAQAGSAQNQGMSREAVNNYLNNPVLEGQIDAASRDITRNLRENELTGIDAQAAATGNAGSSRKQMLDFGAGQRAAERIGDISSRLRGQALDRGMQIEADRARQNAQLRQQGSQFDASAQNQLTSQGLGIAGNQASQQASLDQGANLADQSAANAMTSQGVGVEANRASQNAGFRQQTNLANQAAQNQFLGQGYNAFENNLNRQQQANIFNAQQQEAGRQFGAGIGQNMYNQAQGQQRFGANMLQNIGQAGVGNMMQGQNMYNTGVGQMMGAGTMQRAYDQQLLQNQFQQGMAPYNAAAWYNQIIGSPNNLSRANSTSSGSSSGFNIGFGK